MRDFITRTTDSGAAKRPPRFVLALALIALIAMPHAALASSERNELTIAIAIAETGPRAAREDGRIVREAAEAAVTELNAAGGVEGARVVLKVFDDACQSRAGELVATAIAAIKPALVIGHTCSNAATNARGVYRRQHVLAILTGPTHPLVTSGPAAPTVFRLPHSADKKEETIAGALIRAADGQPVALVHDRTLSGRNLIGQTASELQRAGKPAALTIPFVAGLSDYSGLADALIASRAKAVLLATFPVEAGLIARALRERGSSAVIIGPETLAQDTFANEAAGAAEGVIVVLDAMTRGNLPAAQNHNEDSFDEVNGAPIRAPRTLAHETLKRTVATALKIWGAAYRADPDRSSDAIAQRIARTTYASPFGGIKFDKAGDTGLPGYTLWRWSEGALTPMR
jgi:branched-chain amino acid transport system substrate-binding protein